MKTLCSALSAAILFGAAIHAAPAAVQVSLDFFHDHLESYGDWREVGDYGYCWQPRDVERDWRPYNDGRWLYTDAGWTWDSDEPYSWAVYHYGRWAQIDRVGWVWVPGTEWGPAWVSWRHSSNHVGWAPLPPEARFSRSVGFDGRVDADYDIGPSHYNFVEVRNFGAPRLRTVIVAPRQNITIIRQTRNITRINYINNVVHNHGPHYDVIARESAQPIRRLKLERRENFDGDPRTVRAEQLRTRVDGDSFRVMAPSFDSKAATAPRKVAARVEKAEIDRGWKDAGPPGEVEELRARMKSDAAGAATQPGPATPPTIEPARAERPAAPDQRKKPGKAAKAGKPKQNSLPAPPPTAERIEPSKPARAARGPSRQTSPLPAETRPSEKANSRLPKRENAAPAPKLPPRRPQVQPSTKALPPEPKRPATHPPERKAPAKQDSRAQESERRQKAAPVQPPQARPAPEGKKGKFKDEKKDRDE